MRIGVLTAGGDCPGLNAVIRDLVRTANSEYDSPVLGFQDGWAGLVNDRAVPLFDDEGIDRILLRGGTILGTGRLNPDVLTASLPVIRQTLERHAIDALVASRIALYDSARVVLGASFECRTDAGPMSETALRRSPRTSTPSQGGTDCSCCWSTPTICPTCPSATPSIPSCSSLSPSASPRSS